MNKATKTQPQAAHNILVSAHAGTDKVPADSADSAKQPAARKSTSRSLIKGDDPKAGHPEAPKNRRLRGSELEPLSDAEQADYEQKLGRLKEIEGSWFEAGEALLEIRDQRLYREHHPDFETFCRKELGMGKSNCNRKLQTTQVARLLATRVAKPVCEGHIRPLLRLTDPAEQEQAFRKAVDRAKKANKPLTGAFVAQEVRVIRAAQRDSDIPSPIRPVTKADLLTQISRAVIRDLEALSSEQLQAFEKACLEFKSDWLAAQPPEPPPVEAGKPQEVYES